MFEVLDKKTNLMLPLLLLLMGLLPLAGAYISEYGFGYEPCPLCLYQRIPYAIVIMASTAVLILGVRKTTLSRFLCICVLMFVVDAGIAFFHTGVEQHWWEGLEGCNDNVVGNTIAEIKAALMATAVARCDEPALLIIGLSMAAWNFLYATACAIITFILFRRYARG